jgi:hypothetical protein
MYQIDLVSYFARNLSNLTLEWVDWFPMPKKLDSMDNWKAREIYWNKGLELGKQIDLSNLA